MSKKRKDTLDDFGGAPNSRRRRTGISESKIAEEAAPRDNAIALLREGSVPIPEEEGVTFPQRLMELILDEADREALWWLPGGNAFCIHSQNFTKTILAKNFQGSKFESFTRKLARWGFKRVNNQDAPNGTLAFEHPKFNRSRPELAKEISGSKQKNAPSASTPASNAAARASGAAKSKEVSTPSGPAPAPWPIAAARQASVLPSASIMSSSQEQQQPPPRQQQQQQLLLLSSNELQPDFESQLFLRSIRNHLLTQRTAPDRLLRGTGSSNTTENQDPYSVAAILAQRQQQQQRASELSSVLSGANAPNSSLLTGNQLSSFFADNQSLSSRYQHQHPILQHHSQLSSTAAAANASPRNVDIILQMYLQQQQQQHRNNRGHVILLLQQELLRQDMLRLEQERREQERDNQGRRSKPNGGN